jgi:hypothetical protein
MEDGRKSFSKKAVARREAFGIFRAPFSQEPGKRAF